MMRRLVAATRAAPVDVLVDEEEGGGEELAPQEYQPERI